MCTSKSRSVSSICIEEHKLALFLADLKSVVSHFSRGVLPDSLLGSLHSSSSLPVAPSSKKLYLGPCWCKEYLLVFLFFSVISLPCNFCQMQPASELDSPSTTELTWRIYFRSTFAICSVVQGESSSDAGWIWQKLQGKEMTEKNKNTSKYSQQHYILIVNWIHNVGLSNHCESSNHPTQSFCVLVAHGKAFLAANFSVIVSWTA